MSKTLLFIPLSLVRSFIVVRLHPYEQIIPTVNYKRKNVGACICLFYFVAYHSHTGKQTEKHPTLEHIDIRKVCVEDTRPSQHTTESIYYTPWSYPCDVLDRYSIVEVSKTKNKASVTPFHNVVHRPRSSSLLKEYHSQWGNSFCKSTKKK